MINAALVAEKTVVNAKGDGPAADLSAATGRIFLLTLDITKIIEQESLEISIFGSVDGAAWGPSPSSPSARILCRPNSPLARFDGAS
jgi:hypothetical protein